MKPESFGLCIDAACFHKVYCVVAIAFFILACCWFSCHKDWRDFSASGPVRQWPVDGVAPDPFHAGAPASIRMIKPAGDSIHQIKIDVAHSYAISGFGKDELASSLIFVVVHCRAFGSGNWQDQLEWAYCDFNEWCQTTKRRTTIKEFSKRELKMLSLPV